MKRLLLLFFVHLFFNSNAQLVEHEWTRPYQAGGSFRTFTSDMSISELGYVYSVHSFESTCWAPSVYDHYVSNGEEDIMISKTSDTKTAMWSKHIGGSGSDYPSAVERLSNGNLLVAGSFSDTVDFDPGPDTVQKVSNGEVDNFLLVLDEMGNFVSCVTFGGSGSSHISDLIVTEDNEIFICGSYMDSMNLSPLPNQVVYHSSASRSSYITKFNSNLHYISSAVFDGNILINDLFRTTEGKTLFIGDFEDTCVIHLANSTEEVYSKEEGDVLYGEFDDQLSLLELNTINSENDQTGWSICQLSDGSQVLQLSFRDSVEINIGEDTMTLEGLHPSQDTLYNLNYTEKNTLLLCLSQEGVKWHKVFSSVGKNGRIFPFSRMALDENDNIITSYYCTYECDLGDENYTNIGEGNEKESFFIKIHSDGSILWVRNLSGSDNSQALIYSIQLQEDHLYAGGQFSGSIDFDLSTNNSGESGWKDPFISKWTLHDEFLSTENVQKKTSVSLFPNPANDFLFVDMVNMDDLEIYDLSGKEITLDYALDGQTYQISTSHLQNGMYILTYTEGNSTRTERFIVQH